MIIINTHMCNMYYTAGKVGGGKFVKFTLSKHLAKISLQFNKSARRLLIVSTVLIWIVLVWLIIDNSPNFSAAKFFYYTVGKCKELCMGRLKRAKCALFFIMHS